MLHLEGHGRYTCAEHEFAQAPGDVMLLDGIEPCEVVHAGGARVLRWSLSEEMLAPVLPPSSRWPTRHFPARDGLNAVLARHARNLAHEAERLDLDAKRGLLTHLCGLVGLTIEASASPRPERRRNYRTHLRQRILTYIETHLRDPDLTARRAAEDLSMSPRWLHMLLGDAAISFADLVARRRLERSFDLLHDPASDPLSIAEIAFHSGFNDLSTFYRRFRDRYGTTPREARRVRGTGRA